jgi:hypothetical protein
MSLAQKVILYRAVVNATAKVHAVISDMSKECTTENTEEHGKIPGSQGETPSLPGNISMACNFQCFPCIPWLTGKHIAVVSVIRGR